MVSWAKRFERSAKKSDPAPASATKEILISNFLEDALFGRAAKYVIAWKASVQNLLEESGFYSLGHLLEADSEVDCSLLLASHLYHKQAMQVLRNLVEELVLPIHFCDSVAEYDQWKASNYRVPPLRGRDGLIRRLVSRRILPDAIGNEVISLYGDLNDYIHGSENHLIHKGFYIGSWDGFIFKYDDFGTWCNYLSRTLDLGIKLLRLNYVQWDKIFSEKWKILRAKGKILCDTCHNEEDFDVAVFPPEDAEIDVEVLLPDGTSFKADRTYPGVVSHIYRCLHCGSKHTISQSRSSTVGF